MKDHRATLHTLEVGSLLQQISGKELEIFAPFQVAKVLNLGVIGRITDGTVDRQAGLEQLLNEDASDVSGGTGDHDRRGCRDLHILFV